MSFDPAERNRDLCQSIVEGHQHIERYLDGVDLDSFRIQAIVQDAVCMRLQQVLECASKLSSDWKAKLKIDWPAMIAMRNKISHDYGGVVIVMVWRVVRELDEYRKLIEFAQKQA